MAKYKTVQLPEQVLKTAHDLELAKDPRFSTMQALIIPREIKQEWDDERDYPSKKSYEDMWEAIRKNEEKIRGELSNSDWVLDFLDDVIAAQNLPSYFYADIKKRLTLIEQISSLTRQLNDLYIKNGSALNARLNKALRRKDCRGIASEILFEDLKFDKISGEHMANILNDYTQSLIVNIGSAEFLTKDSQGVEERMFAFALVKRNEFLYQTQLYAVVGTAMWAILGRNHTEGTIRNMYRRSQEL